MSYLQLLGLSQICHGSYSGSWLKGGASFESRSPINNAVLGAVTQTEEKDYEQVVCAAQECFQQWRSVPAPKRGEIVRQIGEELRRLKVPLGQLISFETGKITAESEGEVQEAIDIADFAVGLSRQLYGLSMHSERSAHRMYEQWHPLGLIGVITSFNFPLAVWAWNAMIAAVCGDVVIWKGSELAPLTAIAVTKICAAVAARNGFPALFTLVTSNGPEIGKRLAADKRIPLISATGSCAMGRAVGEVVAARFGRTLLELGGNNAVIVCADANLDLAVRAILFGAVGTAGQRCTTIRRILVERSICSELIKRLKVGYQSVPIGDPTKSGILMGPLIHEQAVQRFEAAIAEALRTGGELLTGGKRVPGQPSTLYVEPTLIRIDQTAQIVQQETFAPIAYIVEFDTLDQAITIQNDVVQGLSSAIFTENLGKAERFLSASGSDCGIANVNIGTSGAEMVERLVERKRRAAAESPVRIPGSSICVGKLSQLIMEPIFL